MSSDGNDKRVPLFLGRVLDGEGVPVGTCFQVTPRHLATAWHVIDSIGKDAPGAQIDFDSLGGSGEPRKATVHAIDEVADLAILETDDPLDGVVPGIDASDREAIGSEIVITGASDVLDEAHRYRFLDAPGSWAGGTTRDDSVPLGRLTSTDVVHCMSGAPVRRLSDDFVVGVVSGRYNSADGWLAGTVWIARTEQLSILCDELTDRDLGDFAATTSAELTLSVGASEVRLSGDAIDISGAHSGIRPALIGAIDEARRARARIGGSRDAITPPAPPLREVNLQRAGELLGESFLPQPIAAELSGVLDKAERGHQAVRLGVACKGALSHLPWEALPDPRTQRPLALHPLVTLYRRMPTAQPTEVPAPLRILVAIASPEGDHGPVLDYERELRNVVAAVRTARQGNAHVRIVPFATTEAIRGELEADPVHVLHLSGHGSPGRLVLEDEDGNPREIGADAFVDEAIPPGGMPAVVALAACHTNAAESDDEPSFAVRMVERGVAVVIASETSLTDVYATRVFARIYGHLAEAADPDAVQAVSQARRTVQAELAGAGDEEQRQLAALNEWAVLSVIAGSGSVSVLDPSMVEPTPQPTPRFAIGSVSARATGTFVGRRREQRRWPSEMLAETHAGLVLHGIGGVGKTTLAAELVGGTLERRPGYAHVVLTGAISVEALLGSAVAGLRQHTAVNSPNDGRVANALTIAARSDLSWSDRLTILRRNVLGTVPLLLVLDNFEDNLDLDGDGATVRDPMLAALLAGWVTDPGLSRLLVTCRYPFSLPESAEAKLAFKLVGPLSAAETSKLVWALPSLDRLMPAEVERIWRLVGGHPRSLEYLDALLSSGEGRYPDITSRLRKALETRLGDEKASSFLSAERTLDAAMAEVATIAADEVMLDQLVAMLATTDGAQALLLGLSVYREPVDLNAALFQVGELDDEAGTVPDYNWATEEILEVLERHGGSSNLPIDFDALSPDAQGEVAPFVAEMRRRPTPPRSSPRKLEEAIAACARSSLMATIDDDKHRALFVHRWTAGELERSMREAGREDEIVTAHRKAAEYWCWRVEVWPQPRKADVHDLLEARHHYLAAEELDLADRVTEEAGAQLNEWSAWDEEAALIHDSIARLPPGSVKAATWMRRLAVLAHHRGNPEEAENLIRDALSISERLDDSLGVANANHMLGIVMQRRGDLDKAESLYRRSLEISESEQDESAIAGTLHQLGILAQSRGDLDEAESLYKRSLKISEELEDRMAMSMSFGQLGNAAEERGELDKAESFYGLSLEIDQDAGNQSGIAITFHQLGIVAHRRGDLEKAASLYRQSLEIKERLGDQSGIADSNHQLGMIAEAQGDLDEAESLYWRSLEIKERLGDQASVATGLSQFGLLKQNRGNPDASISFHGRALLLRLSLNLSLSTALYDLQRLVSHRESAGDEALLHALTQALGPEDAAALIEILDRVAAELPPDG